jgi:HD-GYP domain-containing protein (c-di-GMP phosphodiesterase class II)
MEREPEAPRRRGRIVYSLLAVLILVGLAPLAIVSGNLIRSNKELLKTSQQGYQLLLASSIADRLDVHVAGLRAQVARVARVLGGSLAAGRVRSDDQVRDLLDDVADESLLYLRFTDARGANVESRTMAAMTGEMEPVFVAGMARAAESLALAHETGPESVVVSEPILLAGEPPRPAALFAVPVVSASSYRGMLFALVDLQSLWREIAESHRDGHAVYAVDPRGRLFASSNLAGIPPGSDVSSIWIVRRFLENPGMASETAPFLHTEQGVSETHLGSYRVTAQGWGVFVQAKERQIYVPVAEMLEETLRWGLVALSLALLASVFFAGTLSTPINRLAAAARSFAAGDFQARADVRASNELGELAETFHSMASKLEVTIQKLRRAAEENNELFLGTARALASAIDAKDPYTRGHSVRVNRYSVILARYMGLDAREVGDIHIASLLHDVGKIGVDDAILKKPGRLTAEEFEIMKSHTVVGATIMSSIRQMKRILPGLRSHHERWQGGGYPDGLVGEEIPLMARIIAVADTFDAMTTHRPYQNAMSFEDAVARINTVLKGVAFEERVVEAFNRAYLAGEFRQETVGDEVATVV